ncbi:hypothetical protein LX32DRAFT_687717 [Colletotrichum zoysiae]|uniref:Uncharacterized protein n=1 Tax=Colletotrichum zoysiae TaxID=1216348 RepID=A0AAD9LX95_9PEZI|nr:hypothetical protein LX32DRAFT_687717 [Colletotrichum zoysiae]
MYTLLLDLGDEYIAPKDPACAAGRDLTMSKPSGTRFMTEKKYKYTRDTTTILREEVKRVSEPARPSHVPRVGMSPNLQFLVAYNIANTFSDLQLATCLAAIVGGINDLDDGSRKSTYRFMIAHRPCLVIVHGSSEAQASPTTRTAGWAVRLARALRICFMAAGFVPLNYAFWATAYEANYNKGQDRRPMKRVIDKSKGVRLRRLMGINMAPDVSLLRGPHVPREPGAKELDSCTSEGPQDYAGM